MTKTPKFPLLPIIMLHNNQTSYSSHPSTGLRKDLDCLCEAYYNPRSLIKPFLNGTERTVCRSGFQKLLESYGSIINPPSSNHSNHTAIEKNEESCRETYLHLLPKGFCSFPWAMDDDPLLAIRSSYICGVESTSKSCQEKMFHLHLNCRWFGDHCAPHPPIPQIDNDGYCATFTTANECRDKYLNMTGHCLWYEKDVDRDTTLFSMCCEDSSTVSETPSQQPISSIPSLSTSTFPSMLPSTFP